MHLSAMADTGGCSLFQSRRRILAIGYRMPVLSAREDHKVLVSFCL